MHSGLGMTKNRYYIKGSCGKYMVLFIVPKMGREAGYGRKKAKADSGKKAIGAELTKAVKKRYNQNST